MSFPAIPDSLYKLLILLGLAVMFYAFYDVDNAKNKFELKQNTYFNIRTTEDFVPSLTLDTRKEYLEKRIKEKDKRALDINAEMSKLQTAQGFIKQPNNLKEADIALAKAKSLLAKYEKLKLEGVIISNELKILIDSIGRTYEEQLKNEFLKNNISFRRGFVEIEYKQAKSEYENALKKQSTNYAIGIILILVGGAGMFRIQTQQDELLKRQVNEKEKIFDFCQSCGSKFTLLVPYGTKADNSLNKSYCLECYKDGEFTEPTLSKSDLEKRTLLKFGGFRNFINRQMLKVRINNLERWKGNKYF